jgi:hypothetical protein
MANLKQKNTKERKYTNEEGIFLYAMDDIFQLMIIHIKKRKSVQAF